MCSRRLFDSTVTTLCDATRGLALKRSRARAKSHDLRMAAPGHERRDTGCRFGPDASVEGMGQLAGVTARDL